MPAAVPELASQAASLPEAGRLMSSARLEHVIAELTVEVWNAK